jgi:hypothetical protein
MHPQRHPRHPALVRVASAIIALSCFAAVFAAEVPAQPSPQTIAVLASTVPPNRDVSPHWHLRRSEHGWGLGEGRGLLVSNFNAISNLQGTGTTPLQEEALTSRGGDRLGSPPTVTSPPQTEMMATWSKPHPMACRFQRLYSTAMAVLRVQAHGSDWSLLG